MHFDCEMEVVVEGSLEPFLDVDHFSNEDTFAIIDLHIACVLILRYHGIGKVVKEQLVPISLTNHLNEVLLVLTYQKFLTDDHVTIVLPDLESKRTFM